MALCPTLEDGVFEDGDIFGDGMNVAAARVGKSRFAIDGGCFRRSGTERRYGAGDEEWQLCRCM
jgi:hypothetical protein